MKEVKKYLESRMGEYSFYFEHVESGYVYAESENVQMDAAGCIKLPLAISLLKSVEKGDVRLKDVVKITSDDMVCGNGIIHEFGEKEYTINELLLAMLIQGDNTAANKIIDIMSLQVINSHIKALGLINTSISIKDAQEKNVTDRFDIISTTKDLSLCWRSLCNGNFINRDNSNMIINTLKKHQTKNKVAFYMPEDIKRSLANKSGEHYCVENDTLLMTTDKGNFILTVISGNLPNNIYGKVTLSRMGKMVWDIINTNWSHKENKVKLNI